MEFNRKEIEDFNGDIIDPVLYCSDIEKLPISETFKHAFCNCIRENLDELYNFMLSNGFFKAPASTKHHQNWEGGLAEHSYSVLRKLIFLNSRLGLDFSLDSMIIVALLHDICKIDCYTIHEDKTITWNEDARPGHGKKSVAIISEFIKLTKEEEEAIAYHMGAYEKNEYTWSELSQVYKRNKLAFYLHVADMKDTYGF